MNNLSLAVDSLEWGRNKVLELASQGHSQSEIARIIQISQLTVNRDSSYLRQHAKNNIKKYIDERLPEGYEKFLVGLPIIKSINRTALSAAMNTYSAFRSWLQ